MNRSAAWMAFKALFIAIGAMSTVAYVAAMPWWIAAIAVAVATAAWWLLYKMLNEWEATHGSRPNGTADQRVLIAADERRSVAAKRVVQCASVGVPGDVQDPRPVPRVSREVQTEDTDAVIDDAISALVNLGYSKAAAINALRQCFGEEGFFTEVSIAPDPLEIVVRGALGRLAPTPTKRAVS